MLQDWEVKATVIKARFDLRISAPSVELIIEHKSLKGVICKAPPVQMMAVRVLIVQGLSHIGFIFNKVSRLGGESRHHSRKVYQRSSVILIVLIK
jgi:hypothetical protein